MKQTNVTIQNNTPLCPDWFMLSFTWDTACGIPQPGQFVTLRIINQTDPLLRRPFAISGFDLKNSVASIIYQRRGNATGILSSLAIGDTLDCIGPLGNGFIAPPTSNRIIAIAGGIGLGPIAFFVREMLLKNRDIRFIFGCRSASMVPDTPWFKELNPLVCTDDGSMGFAGNVSDYLKTFSNTDLINSDLYCCGPTPMLKACALFAQENKLTCKASVEQVMACGVGACMGCVVKTVSGFARACKDGPVFDANMLVWE